MSRAEKLFQQERFEEAIPYLEKSAALGNDEAYLMLGRIYIRLAHNESDIQRARASFEKNHCLFYYRCAKREILFAQLNLGHFFDKMAETTPNEQLKKEQLSKAEYWLTQAANQNSAAAQRELALFYRR